MEPAFWDSSSLVPLCVKQRATPVVQALSQRYSMIVWWAAPIEIRSASARLLRMRQLSSSEHVVSQVRLDELRSRWVEICPDKALRTQAERLIDRFPIKAADAQQLAAAMTWCLNRPRGRVFISGDNQLLDAARQLGFQAIET